MLARKHFVRPLILALGCLSVVAVGGAQATTLTVTSNGDQGPGTLRAALASATGGDTINFDSSVHTITLTSTELSVTAGITISGPGARDLTITRSAAGGTPDFRIFSVTPSANATASISGVTISNGEGTPGGGISFTAGANTQLNLTNVVVTGNDAAWGGGIDGTGNQTGHMTIDSSTISGNTTNHGTASPFTNGAAMKLEVPTTIVNSTMSGNQAGDNGGAIKVDSDVTIVNSTIANNTAATKGGGIWISSFANHPNLVMRNTLIADNTAGTGEHQCDIETNNTTLSVNENNLIEDGSCNFLWASGGISGSATNFLSGDPNLGSLSDNGGPTNTQALGGGSIASGSGDNSVCSASPVSGLDQRGLARPNPCSRGAYDGAAPDFNLNVSKSGSGNGTVTSSPAGIDCGSTCSVGFSPATTVTLTATAANGSTFTGWSEACSGTAPTCDVLMNQVQSVNAEFSFNPPTTTTEQTTSSPTSATTESSSASPSGKASTGTTASTNLATPALLSLSIQRPGIKSDGCVIKTARRHSFTIPFELSADSKVSAVLYYRKRSEQLVDSCKAGSGSDTKSKLKTARKWTFDATDGKHRVKIPFELDGKTLKAGRYTLEMIATDNTGQRKVGGAKFFIVSG